MDELGEAFKELSNNYDFLKEVFKIKKKNETLQNKIVILFKEKDDLSSTLLSIQKDFDAYKISCKAKFLLVDKNEISILKDKINFLEDVLKKCEFDKTRLRQCFLRNTIQRNMFMLHMLIILHILTLLNHNISIHIMLDMLHTPSMLIPHTRIMFLSMVEFIDAHIVTRKIT